MHPLQCTATFVAPGQSGTVRRTFAVVKASRSHVIAFATALRLAAAASDPQPAIL
jgi:hypothetical protein